MPKSSKPTIHEWVTNTRTRKPYSCIRGKTCPEPAEGFMDGDRGNP